MNAENEYVHGEMDIEDQSSTWSAFMTITAWSALIIILMVGHATFTLTMGVNWLVSMGVFALVGVLAGVLMNLGGAWIASVVGLVVLGVIVQVFIMLGQALI